MQFDRDIGTSLERFYKLFCIVRKKQSCHVLDAEGIRAHLLDLAGDVHPVIFCVSVTQCIGQRDLCVAALFLCRLDGCLKVSEVVKAVEDTDPVDSVRD